MGYQRSRGHHRPGYLRRRRHLGTVVARHAGQGDHRPRPLRHERAHRSLHGVQRDAARLREAHALALRGAVPLDVRDETRLLRLDLPEARRPRDTIGLLENEWNDFDRLTAQTKMLHTTRRKTQPWKSGLPVDWRPAERFRLFPPIGWLMRARRQLFGEYAFLGNYKEHPDANQEHLFFGLLRECIDAEARHRRHAARRDAAQPRAARRIRGARPHAGARAAGSSAARVAGLIDSERSEQRAHALAPCAPDRSRTDRGHATAPSPMAVEVVCNKRPARRAARRECGERRGAFEPARSTSPADAPAASSGKADTRCPRCGIRKVEQIHRLSGGAGLGQHRHAVCR